MEAIKRQAALTFCRSAINGKHFDDNFSRLVHLMKKLTAVDVALDENLLTPRKSQSHAPVTYVEILSTNEVTISMFVLRPGSRLPLHDHPLMYGLAKVVAGCVKVRSFTPVSTQSDMSLSILYSPQVSCQREADKILKNTDPPVVLTPSSANIHEITAVGESGAAFVDVLSPPYHTYIPGYGERACHYYEEPAGSTPEDGPLVNLVKMSYSEHLDYWTDTAPYLGL